MHSDTERNEDKNLTHQNRTEEITSDVIDFIYRRIRSVGHLDALMLMARDDQKEWDANSLSYELRTNTSYASQQLDDLFAAGLIKRGSNHKFKIQDSSNPEIEIVNKLIIIYKERPSRVISIIYERPLHSLHGFVESFKIRKD